MRTTIFPGWWQVVVAIVVQAASTTSIFTAFSIIAVPLQGEFESSRTLLMMVITATVLGAGVVNPFIGTAMDRYSLRSLMLVGAGLLVAGFLTLSFTTAIHQAVVVYALFMASATVLLGPLAASTLLARWFHRRRGLAMGIAASGTAIGGLILPPLLQGLIDAYEWRSALRIFSAILFVCTVPVILFLTINRPADRQLHPDGDNHPVPESVGQQHAKFGSTAGVLRNPNFWFISAIMGLMFSGITALTSNLLPLVIDKGITAEQGALLLSFFSVGNFGGKILFAGVGDRVELRLALVSALVLQALGVFGFLRADGYTFLICASLLLGLAIGGMLPLWGFLLARVFGAENLGRVMGLMGSVVTMFNLSAPMLFGFAFDSTGSYNVALIAYIVLLFVAMSLLPYIRTQAVVKPAMG